MVTSIRRQATTLFITISIALLLAVSTVPAFAAPVDSPGIIGVTSQGD